MTTILVLLFFALLFFFLEIFLPGGLLALLGGALVLAAAWTAYGDYGLAVAVAIGIGGGVLGLVLFFVEIRILTRSPMGHQLRLESRVEERLNPRASDELVGMEGVTLTTLAPSGRVQIEGKVYTAASDGGLLEKGTPVRVVRSDTFKLIVTRK